MAGRCGPRPPGQTRRLLLFTGLQAPREAVLDAYRTVDALTPDIPLYVGVLPGHPAIHDEATTVDIVDGLPAMGVLRVCFYSYGLLPERSLDWIDAAIP